MKHAMREPGATGGPLDLDDVLVPGRRVVGIRGEGGDLRADAR
jgi:hypothetical protein